MEIRICVVINKRCPALSILFGRLPHKTDHLDCKIDHDNVVFGYCCFTKPEFKKIQASRKKTKAKQTKPNKKYFIYNVNKIRLISDSSGTLMEESRVLRGRGGVTKGIIHSYLFI